MHNQSVRLAYNIVPANIHTPKGVNDMNVIVHYPTTPEQQATLETKVAKAHAEHIARYIEKLNCSAEEKLALIDAIIRETTNRQ